MSNLATVSLCVLIAILPSCSEPPKAEAHAITVGTDYSSLYDDDTLAYWASRYEPAIRENFTRLIIDSLRPKQLQKVRGWSFDFPRRDRYDPVAYYVDSPPPRITISALSIKFLDDFAVATAWLELHGYSIETAAYYADVLKYRRSEQFPNGRYPAPLQALRIPANALKDTVINDVALKILNTAVLFALAHEVGHIVNSHKKDVSSEQLQLQETQADSFAVSAFKRIGLAPAGIVTFFFLTSRLGMHRGDFDSDSAWTLWQRTKASHPLSSRRLNALAAALRASPESFAKGDGNAAGAVLRVEYIAQQIEGIAAILDDPLLHEQAKLVGENIPLTELRPRRVGHPWLPKR